MKYLLDTNTVSDLFNKSSDNYLKFQKRLRSLGDNDDICISILTLYELEYGYENAPKSIKEKLHSKIYQINTHCSILTLTKKGVNDFGKLKTLLRSNRNLSKEKISEYNVDLMLASTAIVENATIISADGLYSTLSSFNSNLKVKNWTV